MVPGASLTLQHKLLNNKPNNKIHGFGTVKCTVTVCPYRSAGRLALEHLNPSEQDSHGSRVDVVFIVEILSIPMIIPIILTSVRVGKNCALLLTHPEFVEVYSGVKTGRLQCLDSSQC